MVAGPHVPREREVDVGSLEENSIVHSVRHGHKSDEELRARGFLTRGNNYRRVLDTSIRKVNKSSTRFRAGQSGLLGVLS